MALTKVRMLHSRARLPAPGSVAEFPDEKARELISKGLAEAVGKHARNRKPAKPKPMRQASGPTDNIEDQ